MKDRCPLGNVGLTVYNCFYWPYLMLSCAVLFVPALALYCLTFWDPRRRLLHRFTSVWGAHYLAWAPFARVDVEGREHGRSIESCVYVSNHQSMVDILAVFAIRLPFLWISKLENFYVPFLGWTMWLNNYVPVKRGNLRSIRRMLRRCERALRGGSSLFVFPEGTRSNDGNLQKFFRGAFWVAARNRVPVVPVIIDGTARILPKRTFRIRPQPVTVRLLDPIDPAVVDYDSRKLRDLVHSVMAQAMTSTSTNVGTSERSEPAMSKANRVGGPGGLPPAD
jgi:1-acyl-sn-glycerol-3-phosphate acyltransferase